MSQRIKKIVALPLAALLSGGGCAQTHPGTQVLPSEPSEPAACRAPSPGGPSPRPAPYATRLAWRAEEVPDGSIRMTVGDIDRAPKAPDARSTVDYRHPADQDECDNVRIVRVKGWWCTTTVNKIVQSGPIVIGGPSQGRIDAAGFSTRCSGRPHRMRQLYQIERDSWSGWRAYGDQQDTPWTADQRQDGPPISVACPHGRVGTYNYRMAVIVQIDDDGLPQEATLDASLGPDPMASSPPIRTSCGTGIS